MPVPPLKKVEHMAKIVLRLYITGKTPRSEQAIKDLEQLCTNQLKNQGQMEIIDVLKQPQLAEDEMIIATPTLVKEGPLPPRRIIGDLSNTEKVLIGLDLLPLQDSTNNE
jgi:circadian clock protein KaiB